MNNKLILRHSLDQPASIRYERWEAFAHPTGHMEFLPVIIAQGREKGPCLWLTAGIHGPEQVGPWVIYRLIDQKLVDRMRGTIVAIPALNPAGLRTMQREPYHTPTDPNRLWPDGKPAKLADPDKDPPSILEVTYKKLYDEIVATASCLIDYHAAWTGSLSFAFYDRYLYRSDGGTDSDSEKSRAEAEVLSARQLELLRAYGHTIISEMPVDKLIDDELHRSTSAAVFYLGKVPAFTVELGTGHVPDLAIVNASVTGTRNVMRRLGMLDGEMETITGIKIVDPGFPVRRCSTPRVKEACVVMHLVEAGDMVKIGDPVAEVCDIWGRPIGEGILRSEYDGFIIGRQHGIYYYPGAPVLSMAIRDNAPRFAPYPPDYFKI